MSETMRMWVEISFNVLYLVAIYWLVALMFRQRDRVAPADRPVASRITLAFFLLALGDTGHVGFRVLAYRLGDLAARPTIAGVPINLVGWGALATAVTVTFFYLVMLDVWRVRFAQRLGWFGWFLVGMALLRFALMTAPGNQWGQVVPPQPWSLIRNAPLMVLGLGTAYLILRDARRAGDSTFTWIGVMILVSYACYMPVVFLVQRAPLVGMLMIPKTLAYIAIAVITYRGLYGRTAASRRRPPLIDGSGRPPAVQT